MNMIIMIRSSIQYPLKIQTMQLQVVNLQGCPRLPHLQVSGVHCQICTCCATLHLQPWSYSTLLAYRLDSLLSYEDIIIMCLWIKIIFPVFKSWLPIQIIKHNNTCRTWKTRVSYLPNYTHRPIIGHIRERIVTL